MRAAGFERPRIAVAGLNPHAGDGGNFGREEIDVIGPAVRARADAASPSEGPFPSDTVFLRARNGEFDAVLTMYHDQGQIAMKLMGFERGVTLLGGFPFPICTPAHGTAYDIAGKGVANVGAGPRGPAARRHGLRARAAPRPDGRAQRTARLDRAVPHAPDRKAAVTRAHRRRRDHCREIQRSDLAGRRFAVGLGGCRAGATGSRRKPIEFVVTVGPGRRHRQFRPHGPVDRRQAQA